MKKYISIFLLVFSCYYNSQAQILTPQVISTAGEQVQAGGVSLSYTVGEAGGVTTQTAGGVTLTQGFQQVDPVKTTASSGNTPVITVTASLVSFNTTAANTPSSTQSFSVSGTNLQNNLSISAPSNFEISTSQNSGFGASVSLTPSSGSVSTTTIYVRYNPSALGTHSGKVSCTSANATTKDISVDGSTPIIYVTANLSTFTTNAGTPSSAQSFTISGSYLLGNINLSAPAQFEISLSQSTGFGSSLSLTPISGSVATTSIYVRYNPSASGSNNGNISCNSTSAVTQTIAVSGTTGNPSPVIITSVNALNSFTTTAGTPSSSQSFTVSGNDLTANLVVTAPSQFEVSLSSSSGFGNSVSFTPSSGKVNNASVYVRYNPSSAGTHSGNVVCSSTNATSQNVALNGNSSGSAVPNIITNISSLNAFSTSVGTPSGAQSFNVSGSDLSANIVVTAPSQFEVSLGSSSGFGNSVSLTPSAGTVSSTTIYVRYNPSVAGPHNGNVVCSSTGATSQNVVANGTTSGTITPVITTSTNSLNAFSTQLGTPSTAQLFTVIGSDLNGLLVVSAPSDFQVSLSSNSGFGGSVYFTPSGGKVNNGVVYVRYNPTTSGSHSGNVQCASAGATTQNVAVSGTATTPAGPVVTATNISNTFTTVVGTPSAAQAMAVSGSNLTGNITITSPTQFEVSLSVSSGFTNTLNLTPSSGSVSTTIIYVRYNPSAAGSHSGSVNVSSQNANTQSVNVNGVSTNTGIIAAQDNSMGMRLFPNPTNSITNLDFNLSKSNSVMISMMDIQGRNIMEKTLNNLPAGTHNTLLDMGNVANGIYIVKLTTANGQSWCKLVVEK